MINCHPYWGSYVVEGQFIGKLWQQAEMADAFTSDELLLVSQIQLSASAVEDRYTSIDGVTTSGA